jgi:cytochrome c peroxidase
MRKQVLLLAIPFSFACQQERATQEEAAAPAEVRSQAPSLFSPLPSAPPILPENPITAEKVVLGKMLFFEPRLSRSWLISCNTCHNLSLAGVDLLPTSVGHGWQKGPRNAPTVFNAVFNIAQFWDGRAQDLMEQAMGPVQAAVEMNNTPERVIATLQSIPEYVDRFRVVFPSEEDPVTFENMARAIEAFEATLLTPDSPFDRYVQGDRTALTALEQQGLESFTNRGCAGCHAGVNMGGAGYFRFGLVRPPGADVLPPGDKGRFAVTQSTSDEYLFRSPTLRNVALTPPYFHSGAIWDLKEAVKLMGSAQLGAQLTDEEADAIVGFLRSLTGRQPQVEYPTLPPHTDGTPLPEVGSTSAGPR